MGRPRTCDCGECRKCRHRDYMRRWYLRKSPEERRAIVEARDPERVRANDRARYYRDQVKRRAAAAVWEQKNPEKVQEAKRRWRERNRDKTRAQAKARRAYLRGDLVRQACEICGTEDTHMHHDDYSKPLDVRWLCPTHHGEIHRKL